MSVEVLYTSLCDTGVLLKITSGNIKKEGLKLKELAKSNKWAT